MLELTLECIQREFSKQDYSRGLEYYRQGRVTGLNSWAENGLLRITGFVHGSERYEVEISEIDDGYATLYCTCPRYSQVGECKHLAAALIAYIKNAAKKTEASSDWVTQRILHAYLHKNQEETTPPETLARLVPYMRAPYQSGYPSFSFKVGRDRLYVVRDIEEFLRNVEAKKTTAYGKNLTLNHSIEQFDERSQKMIRLLMNEYDDFRSIHSLNYGLGGINHANKYDITFVGDAFDRWFHVFEGDSMEIDQGKPVVFCQEDPSVELRVYEGKNLAELDIKGPRRFFGSSQSLYALDSRKLYRCSQGFREKVYPLVKAGQGRMQLAWKDLPTFCGCVLPEIQDQVDIQDPQRLLEEYLPEECTPCFYFDMEDDILSLKIRFQYGDKSFDLQQQNTGEVRRDVKTEAGAIALAERYFTERNGEFTLADEEKIYDFLVEGLEKFQKIGVIYLSDRLNRKRIQPVAANVGVSVSDGLLTLNWDTGEFPREELSSLYQSLLLRKKYHRLPDGRYLELNGSSYEKVAEMAQMLQLSKAELAKGMATMPAYRGLYLDEILSGSEGVQVNRNRQFREMVRNFKAVSESDYTLPNGLEAVLRPYQKTGFQWLKTLENYGFGGILADEMGLGKTLQVIAFLATVPKSVTGHPNLVVCPASLVYNWGEELQKFAPQLSAQLILGTASERKTLRSGGSQADVWVTSYELLRQDIKDYVQESFYCCILDEAQHIKNSSTLISKAVKQIPCRQRFVLTGTPVENRLSELWNLFDFLMSGYLYTNHAFREKLEKPILKSQNPEASQQLKKLVQPFLLRRKKSDVLKELPPKEEHIRRISLSEEERKVYLSCVQATLEQLTPEQGKLKILAALTRLRQICCDPNLCFENYEGSTSKLDACMELCQAMVENGHQILLFSQFTSMLDHLRERLEKAGISTFTLEGSTSKEKRAKLVKAFNAGEASVFLISLKAGGTGLNLTAADVVVHYDPWWNQAAQDQATDRAHRIGQQAHVQVYKLIAKDTIEEKILQLQEKKAALMDTVSGEGSGILDMSAKELVELLQDR